MAVNGELCPDKNCYFNSSWKQHTHRRQNERPKIFSNIMEIVGNTPMVKLNKIPKEAGLKCDIYAKIEFVNPGGSVKDRMAFRMVEEAEEKGLLKPGSIVIEPTSGNTGIALALACAVKGYECILVMPEKISQDKEATMKLLGAKIVRTPNGKAHEDPESVFEVAKRLNREISNSIVLDQFVNCANPLAHYDATGEEILQQCDGHVDMVVVGTGTGGSITGISRKVKEQCQNCEIIGADPVGSTLALPESINKTDVTTWEVEGIGYTYVFDTLHRQLVDRWVKVDDRTTMRMARRLIREEGILGGESSGAILAAALVAAQDLKEGQKCVIIIPDGIRNYMSKFVTDSWMEARGYKDVVNEHNHWWWNHKVEDLTLPKTKVIQSSATCKNALEFLNSNGLQRVAVENNDATLNGFVDLKYLMKKVVSQNYQLEDTVEKAIFQKFYRVKQDSILGLVSRLLETEGFVAVVDGADRVTGVIDQLQLLNFISKA
ncbi:cystathionine beta-synthase-like [Sitodiplosis mosellana]|uniref:cystathionine beta-synthase-like n=1 Tax=Sitodiplosis mosellana TaxID=263140 RepID=UPI0024448BF2|nr:cystathionine beta-synthase-like [Sitodiplosis mosellana]XP_055326644.1 cystathionine beta-synthase-like [Sitodiplosis mosellana]